MLFLYIFLPIIQQDIFKAEEQQKEQKNSSQKVKPSLQAAADSNEEAAHLSDSISRSLAARPHPLFMHRQLSLNGLDEWEVITAAERWKGKTAIHCRIMTCMRDAWQSHRVVEVKTESEWRGASVGWAVWPKSWKHFIYYNTVVFTGYSTKKVYISNNHEISTWILWMKGTLFFLPYLELMDMNQNIKTI